MDEALKALQALIVEAQPAPEDDPWDEKTVDIRPQGIEQGEAERVARQLGLPADAAETSPIMRSYASRHWEQILITAPNGFWVVEMTDKGPVAQSIRVSREGRSYPLSDPKELANFEERFQLDRTPWPGNIVMTKKKVV